MRCRVEAHIGPDQHAGADGDGGAVDKAAIAVDEAPRRHAQLGAVLDHDRRDNIGVSLEIGIGIGVCYGVFLWRRGRRRYIEYSKDGK